MLSPTVTSASCNVNGYTVVYVNGIWTDEQEAKDDKKALERKYIEAGEPSGHLIFLNGHNPSHFAGGGDLYKSAQQTLEKQLQRWSRITTSKPSSCRYTQK